MTKRRAQGFTLIELLIFIVVVSAGLAGILSVMNTTVKSSADPMVRKQAIALADSILEEVLLMPYADPDGTNLGETGRANWDNVDDYNGKTNADFTDLPSELASYLITIAVGDGSATLGVPARKVTVTIQRGIESVSMTGYRANY
jgi:MSHA pilin protein MshD